MKRLTITGASNKDIEEHGYVPDFRYLLRYKVDDCLGLCWLTTEGIISFKDMPKTRRARAIIILLNVMIPLLKGIGIFDCHIFADSEDTARFLECLGFQRCSGIPMVIHFGDNYGEERA